MELKDRFKQARDALDVTQEELASMVGVSQTTINKIEIGKTLKPRDIVDLAVKLKVSADWLLTGKERSPSDNGIAILNKTLAYQSNGAHMGAMEPWSSSTPLTDNEVEIPFFSEVELAAGNGMIDAQEHQGFKLRFARSTLKRYDVEPSHAACVKVSGNSMEPVLPHDSTIGVNTAKTDIVDGKMFALDHDGMLRVKVVYRVPGGGVRLKSFNSDEYPDETYSKDESQLIRIIGRVFWYSVLIP